MDIAIFILVVARYSCVVAMVVFLEIQYRAYARMNNSDYPDPFLEHKSRGDVCGKAITYLFIAVIAGAASEVLCRIYA